MGATAAHDPRGSGAARLFRWAARAEEWARRPAGRLVIFLGLGVYGGLVCSRKMGDFEVYRRAAKRWLEGEPIYRLDDPHRYLYAPIFVYPFVPAAILPPTVGKLAWLAVNLWLAWRVVRLSLEGAFGPGEPPAGTQALLLVFVLRFFDNNISHGQMNLVVLWLILEAYRSVRSGRVWVAGTALSAAMAAKVFPAILLLQLLVRRDLRWLGACVVGGTALLAVPALGWGGGYPETLRGWVGVVLDQARHYEMGNKINQSISAFVYRAFRPHPFGSPWVVLRPEAAAAVTVGLHAAFLGALVATSATGRRRNEPPDGEGGRELALWLLYATVLLPYSWKYYFVNLAPAVAVALRRLREGPRRGLAGGLAAVFALNLLPGSAALGKRAALQFQLWSFHFLALALLFVLLVRGTRGTPEGAPAELLNGSSRVG